jgi:translation initiation factor IF-2
LIDDVKAAMEGKLRTVEERIPLGKAEVKALFGSGKKKVAGCAVTEGKLLKGAQVSVRRGRKELVFEGKLSSLRRVKDLVEEVKEGFECGVGTEDFLDWAVGDIIECYQVRSLGPDTLHCACIHSALRRLLAARSWGLDRWDTQKSHAYQRFDTFNDWPMTSNRAV